MSYYRCLDTIIFLVLCDTKNYENWTFLEIFYEFGENLDFLMVYFQKWFALTKLNNTDKTALHILDYATILTLLGIPIWRGLYNIGVFAWRHIFMSETILFRNLGFNTIFGAVYFLEGQGLPWMLTRSFFFIFWKIQWVQDLKNVSSI